MVAKFACSKLLLFSFSFSFTKALMAVLQFFFLLMISNDRQDEGFIFATMELLPLLLWVAISLVSYYCRKAIRPQTTAGDSLANSEPLTLQEHQPSNWLFILAIIICGAITFAHSILFYSKITTFILFGITNVLSILFTQVTTKRKWFSHHWLGFVLILFFAIFYASIAIISFWSSASYYSPFLISLLLVALIPLRDIIEKYLFETHKVDLINLLASEKSVSLVGYIIYVIYLVVIQKPLIDRMFAEPFVILLLIGYTLVGGVYQYLGVKTIQLYSPNFKYMGDGAMGMIMTPLLVFLNLNAFHILIGVSTLGIAFTLLITYGLYFIGSMIFTEVLIVYFCGLERNTKVEINRKLQQLENNCGNNASIDPSALASN